MWGVIAQARCRDGKPFIAVGPAFQEDWYERSGGKRPLLEASLSLPECRGCYLVRQLGQRMAHDRHAPGSPEAAHPAQVREPGKEKRRCQEDEDDDDGKEVAHIPIVNSGVEALQGIGTVSPGRAY
jgi:hypothetical protein